ncbi:MAG TPA: ABC transporter substrate-binding protein, partial [Chloroflexota bacterium]|nr:ABC transporter substrate-binding protein [Chloroflexota bacterium]
MITDSAVSRRSVLRLFALGATATLLAACGGSAQPAASTPASSPATPAGAGPASVAAKPSPGGGSAAPAASGSAAAVTTSGAAAAKPSASPRPGGTLRIGLVGDLATLEPHLNGTSQSTTYWGVYDRLTAYTLDLKPQPELAESWDVSPDFKTVKVTLRKGVTWHNGRDFTSDDVKYNMVRAKDPKVGAGEFANQANWWTSIDTPDKNTVVLTSDLPRPLVFDWFEQFNIADPQSIPTAAPPQKPVGTGPFTFVEWVQGDHFTYGRNKNYWK